MQFEDFQDGHLGSRLKYRNRTILAILNLYVTPMPPIIWAQSALQFGRCILKNFKMAAEASLHVRMEKNLAGLNIHVSPMPPTVSA